MDIQAYISSGIIESYVLEVCSVKERNELENLALKYTEIKSEMNAVRSSLDGYALSHTKFPPPQLKTNIFEAIRQKSNSPKLSLKGTALVIPLPISNKIANGLPSYLKYAAAAAFALLFASSTLNYFLYGKWSNSQKGLAQTGSDKKMVSRQFEFQKANNSKAMRDLEILRNAELVRIELKGSTSARDANALVYCNVKTNEIFLDVKKLPIPPDSMQYQFWAIVNGKAMDGGMIELCPASDTCSLHQMNSIPDAHAFAISLERKGGNPSPQGQIYAAFGI
jgi:anti-sigma-K factor RskA